MLRDPARLDLVSVSLPRSMFVPFTLLALILAGALLAAPFARATTPEDADGALLHDQQCVSCHGSEVYTREQRLIGSRAALDQQVQRCAANLELPWFDNEIAAVAHLLNTRYYHFHP